MMQEFAELVPAELLSQSGNVFYSGQEAFSGRKPIYILGLNPGGDSDRDDLPTIAEELEASLSRRSARYSAYVDKSWNGRPAGTARMQPRIQHLLHSLNLDPRETPASNLIFIRSNSEVALNESVPRLANLCWPFHKLVIQRLGIRVVVALGATTGKFVRQFLRANQFVDDFVETNNRGWRSVLHQSPSGQAVAALTHPSRVDWSNPNADPTNLVRRALQSRGAHDRKHRP